MSNKKALEALGRCWKPKRGRFYLDMERAWNFVGDYEDVIRAALEQPEVDEGKRLFALDANQIEALERVMKGEAGGWMPIETIPRDNAGYLVRNAYGTILSVRVSADKTLPAPLYNAYAGNLKINDFISWRRLEEPRTKTKPEPVNEWQPIESAPRDRRIFQCRLAWLVDGEFSSGDGFFFQGRWFAVGKFFSASKGFEFEQIEVQPTHWQPLPAPPKGETP